MSRSAAINVTSSELNWHPHSFLAPCLLSAWIASFMEIFGTTYLQQGDKHSRGFSVLHSYVALAHLPHLQVPLLLNCGGHVLSSNRAFYCGHRVTRNCLCFDYALGMSTTRSRFHTRKVILHTSIYSSTSIHTCIKPQAKSSKVIYWVATSMFASPREAAVSVLLSAMPHFAKAGHLAMPSIHKRM